MSGHPPDGRSGLAPEPAEVAGYKMVVGSEAVPSVKPSEVLPTWYGAAGRSLGVPAGVVVELPAVDVEPSGVDVVPVEVPEPGVELLAGSVEVVEELPPATLLALPAGIAASVTAAARARTVTSSTTLRARRARRRALRWAAERTGRGGLLTGAIP
jgi:hypothetical protein